MTLMLSSSAQIGFVLPKMKRSFFLCPKTPSSKDRELAKLCNLLSSLFLRDFALPDTTSVTGVPTLLREDSITS